jgi:putative ABC transport system permease protein
MGLFGVVAIVLSAAGIYGLIAYSVAERRREIGIRMALGARPSQVLAMVVKHAVSLATVGGAIGLVVGFAVAQLLSSLLYGVRPWDPIVYGAVPLLLAIVTLLAALVPTLSEGRRCRSDYRSALRVELHPREVTPAFSSDHPRFARSAKTALSPPAARLKSASGPPVLLKKNTPHAW